MSSTPSQMRRFETQWLAVSIYHDELRRRLMTGKLQETAM
jgi:hypothetical protein